MIEWFRIGVFESDDDHPRSGKVAPSAYTAFFNQVRTLLATPAPHATAIRQQVASRFGSRWDAESNTWVKRTVFIAVHLLTEEEVAAVEAAFPDDE